MELPIRANTALPKGCSILPWEYRPSAQNIRHSQASAESVIGGLVKRLEDITVPTYFVNNRGRISYF
jgi:hypothetical protein